MIFKDRVEAGRQLAEKLGKYRASPAVVYGLPRGGVVVAAEISIRLSAPLDLIITRKISHPLSSEYAIAAIAEDGHKVENEAEVTGVDPLWYARACEEQILEAKRRRKAYRPDGLISAEGKVAILVDDGVATGLTLKLAIQELRHQKPRAIVVAVPVCPRDTAEEIKEMVTEFIALEIPESFAGAIGAYYEDFSAVEDEEVIKILKEMNKAS